jgi:hypothetical protein
VNKHQYLKQSPCQSWVQVISPDNGNVDQILNTLLISMPCNTLSVYRTLCNFASSKPMSQVGTSQHVVHLPTQVVELHRSRNLKLKLTFELDFTWTTLRRRSSLKKDQGDPQRRHVKAHWSSCLNSAACRALLHISPSHSIHDQILATHNSDPPGPSVATEAINHHHNAS